MTPGNEEPPPELDPETPKLVVDVLQRQIKAQDEGIDSLRTKASILLGAAGLILSSLLGRNAAAEAAPCLLLLGGIACGAAALAAVMPVMAARPRRDPRPEAFIEYRTKPAREVQKQLMVQLAKSYTTTEPQVRRMSLAVNTAAAFLVIAVVLVLAMALVKWGNQREQEIAPRTEAADVQRVRSRGLTAADTSNGGTR